MKAVLVLASLLVAANASAEFTGAVVDVQKVIIASDAGKKAKKDLENEFEKKKKEFEKKENELKKKAEEFEKKKMVYSDQVRQEKGMELQQEMMKFREDVGKSQMQMQQKQAEMTKPIIEKVQKAIGEIAKEKNFTAVFERSENSVVWAKGEVDITEDVLKKINK